MAARRRLTRLTRAFYARAAPEVARDLIGCLFVHDGPDGRTIVRLVETEAYRGALDPGSHAYRGPTPRNQTMFGPPGRLYVYFTYGMHWCANIVCGGVGRSEAVLLRAGRPLAGVDVMRRRRGGATSERLLAAGPARLAQAMGISRQHDGATLLRGGRLWCAEDDATRAYRDGDIAQTPRIGLGAGRGEHVPWRFVVRGDAFASRPVKPG